MHPEMPKPAGVLPIHIFHHAFRRGGGKERYAIALASALRRLEYPVVFHAISGDAALAESLGIELRLVPVPGFPRKLESYRFFRQVDRLRPGLQGLQITLSRARVRDVLVSGGTHLGYLERARKWTGPFDILQVWMERQAYREPRLIVAHSDLLSADLRERYQVPESKLRTLYAPVDDRFHGSPVQGSRSELRKKFGWPEDRVVFLFPSRGHGRKGLAAITQALGFFPDQVLLAVAGKSAPGGCPFVKSMGYIEDMPSAYHAADFTILASSYEPFGLVGPESVLCGTRIVFEENVGCVPAIKPDYRLTFSVWDAVSIREAVSKAVALAKTGKHHIGNPSEALNYDPRPVAHAEAILKALER
jgi:glycosyltransferase involved in cell wall biosynthesis